MPFSKFQCTIVSRFVFVFVFLLSPCASSRLLGSYLTSFKQSSTDIERHLLEFTVGSTVGVICGILPHTSWLFLPACISIDHQWYYSFTLCSCWWHRFCFKRLATGQGLYSCWYIGSKGKCLERNVKGSTEVSGARKVTSSWKHQEKYGPYLKSAEVWVEFQQAEAVFGQGGDPGW